MNEIHDIESEMNKKNIIQGTTYIINSSNLRRVELGVVASTGSLVNPASSDSLNKKRVVNLEGDDSIDLHSIVTEHLLEL